MEHEVFRSYTELTTSTFLIHSIRFRREIWTRAHLSLESFFPTRKRLWSREGCQSEVLRFEVVVGQLHNS